MPYNVNLNFLELDKLHKIIKISILLFFAGILPYLNLEMFLIQISGLEIVWLTICLVWLFCICPIFLLLTFFYKKKKAITQTELLIFVTAAIIFWLTSLIFGISIHSSLQEKRNKNTYNKAEKILQLIENYKEKHKTYPTELNLLNSEYDLSDCNYNLSKDKSNFILNVKTGNFQNSSYTYCSNPNTPECTPTNNKLIHITKINEKWYKTDLKDD